MPKPKSKTIVAATPAAQSVVLSVVAESPHRIHITATIPLQPGTNVTIGKGNYWIIADSSGTVIKTQGDYSTAPNAYAEGLAPGRTYDVSLVVTDYATNTYSETPPVSVTMPGASATGTPPTITGTLYASFPHMIGAHASDADGIDKATWRIDGVILVETDYIVRSWTAAQGSYVSAGLTVEYANTGSHLVNLEVMNVHGQVVSASATLVL